MLLTLTLMVNAYLFAIVVALSITTMIALWQHGHVRWSDIRTCGLGLLVVLAVAFVEG